MPNIINALGTRANTTQPLEFQNPTTLAWVQGTVTSTAGGNEFAAQLTGVAPGDYGPGTLKMRIVGLPTLYYNNTTVKVLGTTTVPPATGGGGVTWNGKPLLVAFGGDSKSDVDFGDGNPIRFLAGALGATYGGAYLGPNKVYNATNFAVISAAKAGNTVEDQLGNFDGNLAPLLTNAYCGGIYILEVGVNNILRRLGQTPAQLADLIHQLVTKAVTVGYKVILSTIVDTTWGDQNQGDPAANGTGVQGTPAQPILDQVNAIIRANWQAWGASRFEDMASLKYVDPVNYASSYYDGLHPSAVGQQYEAQSAYGQLLSINAQYFGVPIPDYTWNIAVPTYTGSTASTGAPGQVTGLTLTGGDTTLTANWTIPAGSPTDYRVQIRDTSSAGNVFVTVSRTPSVNPTQLISGLANGGKYEGRVLGVNAVGVGPYSAVVIGTPRIASGPGTIMGDSPLVTFTNSGSADGSWNTDGPEDNRRWFIAGDQNGDVRVGCTGSSVRIDLALLPQGSGAVEILVDGEHVLDASCIGADRTTAPYTVALPTGGGVVLVRRKVPGGYLLFHAFTCPDGGFYKVPAS